MSRHVRRFTVRACLLGLGVLALAAPSSAQSAAEIQQAIDAAYGKFRALKEGKNADYIPALAKVDPEPVRNRPDHHRRQGLHRR